MRYSVFSGGKRLRPILTLESCVVCGGRIRDAFPAACAIEFVHTYSLVHDDLPAMDDDDYRRGKPAVHKAYGEANAILTGDALLTLAFHVIAEKADPKVSFKLIESLSSAIGTKGMVGGQVMDLEYRRGRKDKPALNRINRLKTSRLFEAAAMMGAIQARSSAGEIRAMAGFGANLGMAFQITDDILDKGDYVKAFGASRARQDAASFIKRAKSALGIFGARADFLRAVADHIGKRS
jgi:geranylgeranyl diphosphate synthase type II